MGEEGRVRVSGCRDGSIETPGKEKNTERVGERGWGGSESHGQVQVYEVENKGEICGKPDQG